MERSVRTKARRGMGLDVGKMEVVKTVETGHEGQGWMIVEVGKWVVTASNDHTFKVWDQQEWTCLKTVDTGQGHLYAMAECGGMLATGGYDGSIKLWQHQGTWTCVRTLEGHTGWVRDLVVHGDWLLSGSYDNTVRVWDRTSWECLRVVQTGHTDEVLSLAVHDGKLYCGGGYDDPTIRVIDTTTWASAGVMHGHTSSVYQLRVREGKLFSCSRDNTIKMWDRQTLQQDSKVLTGHTGSVLCLQYDDKVASLLNRNI